MFANVYNQNSTNEYINSEKHVLDRANLKRYFGLKYTENLNDKDNKYVSEFEKNLANFITNLKKVEKFKFWIVLLMNLKKFN
ncbi:hypothetical protein [Mycoplasmopsis felifaucium]|uniref:Uncharacterized protein n=1 Tax=Mycoplasmopsis felifaucium TaxID=35768 RepID=A0ABZ2RSI8_9BACT